MFASRRHDESVDSRICSWPPSRRVTRDSSYIRTSTPCRREYFTLIRIRSFTARNPDSPNFPSETFLGDLTNEVDHDDHIIDFTSGGPKNYGYKTASGKVECKVRGFSLGSVRGQAQLNYERLRQNVLEELTDPQERRRSIPVTNPHFFTRDAASKKLRVVPRTKDYGLVFDKRVVDTATFKSYPYGYA